jgi:hypothetical protein
MGILQNFIKGLPEWQLAATLFVAGIDGFYLFILNFPKNKFSNDRKDNVQKIANPTPSRTLALYMTLIHTM